MRPFDLLFLALFLGGTGVFIAAAVTVLRGRWRRGLSTLAWLSGCTAAYLGVVALVSIATPQRYVAIGNDMCSDDWRIAVTGVARAPAAGMTPIPSCPACPSTSCSRPGRRSTPSGTSPCPARPATLASSSRAKAESRPQVVA